MEKPELPFLVYSEDILFTLDSFNQCILKPLTGPGLVRFHSDSEVIELQRRSYPTGPKSISCCIMPVDEHGKIVYPPSVYSTRSKTPPEYFHYRNRQLYLDAMTKGIELFPILNADEQQNREAKEFPSPEQRQKLERTLELYIMANPDPHIRLAVVNSVNKDAQHALDTFISIAAQYANPVRLEDYLAQIQN